MTSQLSQNIKSIVHSFLPQAKVLLFGSRARGDNQSESDYDVIVITETSLHLKDKITWQGKLRKALIKSLHAPVDVLINSEEEIRKKRKLPGHVVQYAMEEGVVL